MTRYARQQILPEVGAAGHPARLQKAAFRRQKAQGDRMHAGCSGNVVAHYSPARQGLRRRATAPPGPQRQPPPD